MVRTCFIVPSLIVDQHKADMLKSSIEALVATVENPTIRIILSGDTKLKPDLPEEYFYHVVKKPGDRLSYSEAINIGIKSCIEEKDKWDLVVFYSDDIFPYVKDWDVNLYNALNRVPNLVIATCAENLPYRDAMRISWVSFHGGCWSAKPETLEEIGYFDERYKMGTLDDTDYWHRCNSKGYLGAIVYSAPVLHECAATFKKLPEFDQRFKENLKKFEDKWGFSIFGTYQFTLE
jgi:hypothetical protein